MSVKGGKGIWGMPKHQANLDFLVDDHTMSSQYDLDGKLCMRITVDRPQGPKVPLRNVGAVNWCQFRGMLMKSSIYFSDRAEVAVGPWASAQLLIGDHPRMDPLRDARPVEQAAVHGVHAALAGRARRPLRVVVPHVARSRSRMATATAATPLDSVHGLPRSTDWLDPPSAGGRLERVSS